jgi:hypothetical protein
MLTESAGGNGKYLDVRLSLCMLINRRYMPIRGEKRQRVHAWVSRVIFSRTGGKAYNVFVCCISAICENETVSMSAKCFSKLAYHFYECLVIC